MRTHKKQKQSNPFAIYVGASLLLIVAASIAVYFSLPKGLSVQDRLSQADQLWDTGDSRSRNEAIAEYKRILNLKKSLTAEQPVLKGDRDRLYRRIIQHHILFSTNQDDARDWIKNAYEEGLALTDMVFGNESVKKMWNEVVAELSPKSEKETVTSKSKPSKPIAIPPLTIGNREVKIGEKLDDLTENASAKSRLSVNLNLGKDALIVLPFDGNLNDESKFKRIARLSKKSRYVPDRHGNSKSAIELTSDAYIEILNEDGLFPTRNGSDLTICLWYKAESQCFLVSKYKHGNPSESYFFIGAESISATGNGNNSVKTNYNSNDWSHVSVIFSPRRNLTEIHVNGKLLSSGILELNIDRNDVPFVIGMVQSGRYKTKLKSTPLLIDDFRVYGRCLSRLELGMLANNSQLKKDNGKHELKGTRTTILKLIEDQLNSHGARDIGTLSMGGMGNVAVSLKFHVDPESPHKTDPNDKRKGELSAKITGLLTLTSSPEKITRSELDFPTIKFATRYLEDRRILVVDVPKMDAETMLSEANINTIVSETVRHHLETHFQD